MLETPAQATHGVEIPSRRVAREVIMEMFHEQMTRLKADLMVRKRSYHTVLTI